MLYNGEYGVNDHSKSGYISTRNRGKKKGGGAAAMWCMKKEGMKESREDYLETILILNKKSPGDVRPVDIAHHLGITKPSVTRAMTELEKDGHIKRNEKGQAGLEKFLNSVL